MTTGPCASVAARGRRDPHPGQVPAHRADRAGGRTGGLGGERHGLPAAIGCSVHRLGLTNARSAIEGGRKKRMGCLAGWPDCSFWWHGRVVLLELKRSRGGQLSPAQRALHPRLEAAGFPVAVVRCVPEALDAVAAAGIPLRGRVAA